MAEIWNSVNFINAKFIDQIYSMLNITLQRQWLDILEESKKKKAARDKQKKEAMLLEQQAQVTSNTAVEEKNRTCLYKYSWYMPQWSRRQKSDSLSYCEIRQTEGFCYFSDLQS